MGHHQNNTSSICPSSSSQSGSSRPQHARRSLATTTLSHASRSQPTGVHIMQRQWLNDHWVGMCCIWCVCVQASSHPSQSPTNTNPPTHRLLLKNDGCCLLPPPSLLLHPTIKITAAQRTSTARCLHGAVQAVSSPNRLLSSCPPFCSLPSSSPPHCLPRCLRTCGS